MLLLYSIFKYHEKKNFYLIFFESTFFECLSYNVELQKMNHSKIKQTWGYNKRISFRSRSKEIKPIGSSCYCVHIFILNQYTLLIQGLRLTSSQSVSRIFVFFHYFFLFFFLISHFRIPIVIFVFLHFLIDANVCCSVVLLTPKRLYCPSTLCM